MDRLASDKMIWERIRNNESEAIGELFKKYYFSLVRQGLPIAREPEIVQDAVNEVFLRIWAGRARLKAIENIAAYLQSAIRNQLYSALKRASAQNEKLDFFARDSQKTELSYEDILIAQQQSVERKIRLDNAFAALTPRQKEFLQYYFYEGLSYEQIALVSGQTIKTVYNTVYEALKILRREIRL